MSGRGAKTASHRAGDRTEEIFARWLEAADLQFTTEPKLPNVRGQVAAQVDYCVEYPSGTATRVFAECYEPQMGWDADSSSVDLRHQVVKAVSGKGLQRPLAATAGYAVVLNVASWVTRNDGVDLPPPAPRTKE